MPYKIAAHPVSELLVGIWEVNLSFACHPPNASEEGQQRARKELVPFFER